MVGKWEPRRSTPSQTFEFGERTASKDFVFYPYIKMGITFDHRIVDGKDAGLFLKELEQFFQTWNPS